MRFLLILIIFTSLVGGTTINDADEEESERTGISKEFSLRTVKRKAIEDVPGLSEDMLVEAINDAKKETMEAEAKTLRNKPLDDSAKSPISHYKRFVPELETSRVNALIMEGTTRKLAKRLGLSPNEAADQLHGLTSKHLEMLKHDTDSLKECDAKVFYFHGQYRTITGIYNNPIIPLAGVARTAFTRIIPASYADGISAPRRAKDGEELPNARKVSSVVFKDVDHPSSSLSHMNMIWGQFVDHDIDHGAQPNISCAGTCGLNGECFGIPVPENDKPFEGKTCIQLLRDVPVSNPYGILTGREQVTIKSSYLDASQIYGEDCKRFKELREPGTPFLVERKNPVKGLKKFLPKLEKGFCRTPDKVNMPCFKSGDKRTNENPGLSSMHTIWSREHNRIATELQKINKHCWSKDKIFFETRKILGALMQHITYNEYLPSILDPETISRFDLKLKTKGYYRGYNKYVDASIFNAFAGSAFRFGHSQIPNFFNRFSKYYRTKINPPIQMNRFFDPTFLYQANKGGVDSIMRGLARDSSQMTDGFFSKAVQEELVRSAGDQSDLVALNIQRGREHGLAGYNIFRQLAGLERVDTFEGFLNDNIMTQNQINKLKQVYKHPDDVDLFVGGLYEKSVENGIMGPTFSVLLGEQFRRLRKGDRFWYENPGEFTPKQLREIRKSSLAKMICDNSDGIRRMQRFALRKPTQHPSTENAVRPCGELPKINLKHWRERNYGWGCY